VWQETGLIESFDAPQLEPVWRAEISNGYAGPSVADGRVYVFDYVVEPEEAERVICLDANSGDPLWTVAYPCRYQSLGYPDGPRATITIVDGRAYALGAMGHLHCLDAASGDLIWKKEPGVDYDIDVPTWGIAAAPLVEDDLLIAQLGGKPDAALVAWDRVTGEERWHALEDEVSYAAPFVIERGGRRVLICWPAKRVVGMDPTTGEVLWSGDTPFAGMVSNVPTPVVSGEHLFAVAYFRGSFLFRLNADATAVEPVWARAGKAPRDTDALQTTITTPLIRGDYLYGLDSLGEMRCLELATGDRVWEDLTVLPQNKWATIHMVQNGDITWIFNDQGELIIARLTPEGFDEISRAKLIEPTIGQLDRGNGVTWAHPAFANKCVYVRSDKEVICANLAKP
jgi:outer membrane protein assembly factor BamB